MPVRTTLLLLAILALPAAARADEAVVRRAYEVAALLAFPEDAVAGPMGLAEDLALLGEEVPEPPEPAAFLEEDALIELLRASVEPTFWEEDERARLEVSGRRLLVHAPEAVQRQVEAFLGLLWGEASRRVRIDASWLELSEAAYAGLPTPLADALARGRLDADLAGRLRAATAAAGGRVSSASAVVRPGQRAVLGRREQRSYLGDFAVEIAMDSVVGNPIMETLTTGWQLDVVPFRLQGDATLLELTLQSAESPGEPRRLSLEAEPLGEVELPACRLLRFASAARLEPGEALAATQRVPEGGWRVLVVLPAQEGGSRRALPPRILDLRALTHLRFDERLRAVDDMLVQPGQVLVPVQTEPPREPPDVEAWLGRLRDATGESEWEREGAWLVASGRSLFARHEPPVLDRLGAELGSIERTELETLRLEVVLEAETPEGGREPRAQARLEVPAGRWVYWQAGIERTYVGDWDVEVAQEARVGDPIVGRLFAGVALSLLAHPAPVAGQATLSIDASLCDAAADFPIRRSGNAVTGVLEIARFSASSARRDLVLRDGQPIGIDAGETEDGRRLVLTVRLLP
jgi:hypothetical protein